VRAAAAAVLEPLAAGFSNYTAAATAAIESDAHFESLGP